MISRRRPTEKGIPNVVSSDDVKESLTASTNTTNIKGKIVTTSTASALLQACIPTQNSAPLSSPTSSCATSSFSAQYDIEGGNDDTHDSSGRHISNSFVYSYGLSSNEAELRLKLHGKNELPQKVVPKWYIFCMLLIEPMPVMIWLAIIIEAIIAKWTDMFILLAIQMANASIAFYETTQAGDAVAALKASLKPEATVNRDGKWRSIDAAYLVPGDLVLLACGSAVPADCRINHGTIEVDQAALTGESLPITLYKGDPCMMGSTVVRGEVEGTVEYTGVHTFYGKAALLLQDTGEVSNLQNMLMDIMIVLVVISLTLCSVVYLHLVQITSVVEALSFTVVLMVASIPLAIEIVTTTTLALGSKELSNHGAIVTRLSAIEDMAGMAILCSDKTGTLTMNKMEIQEETPIFYKGENQYSLLRYAAMAAKWKEPPRDALDTLTLNAVNMKSLELVEQLDFMPFDPVVKRTEGTVREISTGLVYKTSKGAPHVILGLINNPTITEVVERHVQALGERGIRSLAIARTFDLQGEWVFLGLLTFLDPPRFDTLQTIQDARTYGVSVRMITGDHLLIAKETAKRLSIGGNILEADGLPSLDPKTKLKPANLAHNYGQMILSADGFAQVFPEHKYLIVECLRELGYKTGMTGDGVNDAPALKRADVGIAVHGSTDAARAAADIVLTEPGLSVIVHGIFTARCIFVRIRNFITYRIAATLQLLLFFFIAIFSFRPSEYEPEDQDDHNWPNFFHMPVIMLMLITLLNDGTLIAIGYDNVEAPETPAVWNLRVLFTIGTVLAAVACVSSLLLLYLSLDSWQENSVYQIIGLGGISYGQITTSIFLKVAVSDFLTLFSARAGEHWFWESKPAPILLAAAALALTTSTILACIWPLSKPDGIPTIGLERRTPYLLPLYIWVYCIIWCVIQDAAKVYTFKILKKYNIFGYNDSGVIQLNRIHDELDNNSSNSQQIKKGH
jgi:H+-transporting ATPase